MQANSNISATKSRGNKPGRVPPPPKDPPPASASVAVKQTNGPSSTEREQAIAQRAYLMAELEGFPTGKDMEYWLRAEAEYDKNLAKLKQ